GGGRRRRRAETGRGLPKSRANPRSERGGVTPLSVILTALLGAAPAPPSADVHLLSGADAFRAGNYAAALVEFRVAERMGSAEASWYAAASLVKLGRAEDAVEGFALAERASAAAHDALPDSSRALACYQARLYLCADRWLQASGARAGPRVAAQASSLREAIARELGTAKLPAAIDVFLSRASELSVPRPALALAYAEEAAALAGRTPDAHRAVKARALIQRLQVTVVGGRE